MKILFTSSYFGYKSGLNKASGDILFALLNSNHEIAVLTHYRKIPLPEKINKNFTLIKAPWNLDFPSIKNLWGFRNFAKWIYRFFEDIFRMNYIKKIKLFSPDVVIVNSYSSYLLRDFNFNNLKSVFISHGDLESSRTSLDPNYNINNTIKLLKKFNYLVFVSKNSMNEWISFKHLNNKKSFYIPNCSDESVSTQIMKKPKVYYKKKLGFDQQKFNMVCVANIMHRKGQDFLIDNYSKIKKIIPNVNLYFIGDDHSDFAQKIKRKLKSGSNKNDIIFSGLKKNAMEYIYAADVFVLPSRAEALPLVILESMILNTPIIASNVSGIPEMITNKKEGYLFSIDKIDDFLLKLKDFYINIETRSLFSKNGNKKYWEFFSRKKQIDKYDFFLKKLVD